MVPRVLVLTSWERARLARILWQFRDSFEQNNLNRRRNHAEIQANYTAEQIKTLASLPIPVVFGDHRDTPTGISTRPSWQKSFDGCQELIGRVKAAGGQAEMLNPSDRGIRGNSQMIMQDKNNLQIADLILHWIDERVSKRGGGKR